MTRPGEPAMLECDSCGRVQSFRMPPNKSQPQGQRRFTGWSQPGDTAICRNCVARERERRKYVRQQNREGNIEAYVIFKRHRIPRVRAGSDVDRCKRFVAEAVTVLDARLEFMEVYETRTTVNVKVSFTTRAEGITPEAFRDLCIEAMEKDRR